MVIKQKKIAVVTLDNKIYTNDGFKDIAYLRGNQVYMFPSVDVAKNEMLEVYGNNDYVYLDVELTIESNKVLYGMSNEQQFKRTYCSCKNCTYRLCEKHQYNLSPMHKYLHFLCDYTGVYGICKKRG